MDQTAEDSVLEALYKEASTRRHTADNKQAGHMFAEPSSGVLLLSRKIWNGVLVG